MKILRKIFQLVGFKSIHSQLFMLNIVLVLSGIGAMAFIYNYIQADANTINMAGRQRMLSQKVAKDVLLVELGIEKAEEVDKTMKLFESSMNILLNGNKENGISAPATLDIKNQLGKVNNLWAEYSNGINTLLLTSPDNIKSINNLNITIHKQSPILLKEMNLAVIKMEDASNENVVRNIHLILGLISMLILISVISFLYVHKFLMKPLLPLRKALQMIAKGNITVRLPSDRSDDEMGALYRDYNDAQNDFSNMLSHMIKSSEQLSSSTKQLKGAAQKNVDGMEKQYQEIELLSTAMNEITATIQEVANSGASASEQTERAEVDANQGREVMMSAAKTINTLNEQVQSVGSVIHMLDEDSKDINKVLDVINNIADQTNLLALNAAIEAARAGEAGRGFAVVADEVRGLAARTATSTKEIQEMVEKLQNQVQEAVRAIETGQEQALIGVQHVEEADNALVRIVDAIVVINEMNAHIAIASKEESHVAEEMNQRIVHVADVSQATRDQTIKNQKLADNLSTIGEQLHNYTLDFNI